MPIFINKNEGTTVLTLNNFTAFGMDADTPADIVSDPVQDAKDAQLIKLMGPIETLDIQWIIMDEAGGVVSGVGSPVTTARDQFKYLYNTLKSSGASQITDQYRAVLIFDSNALAAGTATAGSTTTLTDTNKSWTTNQFANQVLQITGGTGSGQLRTIISNTATVLTVSSNDAFTTTPDNTSTYQIIDGFERRGTLIKLSTQIQSEQPLTWTGRIMFNVGKAK